MNRLWSTKAMIEAMGGRPVGTMPAGVDGISIDTRTLGSGDAFFAIRGDRFDGHDFASAAIAAGAGLIVVANDKLPALGHLSAPMIVVDDVLDALVRLGVAGRARSRARIVAITGSVGKTTTKAMLTAALKPSGAVHAAAASFNNHWGVPLTLARMPEDVDYGVFEIGMNHAGEIRPLVKQVRPHVAVVTTIAAAHLGHFRDLDAIATAKAEIFEGVEPGGAALVNRDIAQFELLKSAAARCGVGTVLTFGSSDDANFRLLDAKLGAESCDLDVDLRGKRRDVRIGMPGRHIADNALAVLGAASLAGADVDAAASALASVKAQSGRGARHVLRHPEGPFVLIDESYNANPASMRAALGLLAATPVSGDGRRIAVLGDMLELGSFSEKLHTELAEPVQAAGVERLYLAGGEMAALAGRLAGSIDTRCFEDAGPLAEALRADVGAGDVVMVKSSLGLGFGRVIAALLDAFPADTNNAAPKTAAAKGY